MALKGDPALSGRPEQFELVASPQRARFFRTMAAAAPVAPLVIAVIGFAGGNISLGVIGAVIAVAAPGVMLWLAGQVREWRLRDGRPLRSLTLALNEDPEQAWRRLASGDPAQYTPMKVQAPTENAAARLQAFWPEDERVTFVVIVSGSGQHATPSEIIELRDAQHETFQAARAQGLQKAYAG
ncbi:hypothetical protein [Sediminivirga luteola]|jgi:hypothetical protein|uniref:Uncharacterized protein n=1 Tax=Sediminivirga luteola TaxID=1774748 RepID=A0A8J2TWH7_9MICO|nr:hypothetical protein [Sediminivirga luteola]MCI2266181.1 hypothetical protein [Sediminivirga luteola]GGA08139.1 hypothetical protein GCM10011333_08710 [Sediminivirga luteola]